MHRALHPRRPAPAWPGMLLWLLCLLVPLTAWGSAHAQGANETGVSEYALKSALFFKLMPFVYHPANNEPTLKICLLGSNPFGSTMEKLARIRSNDRPLVLLHPATPAEATVCDFVFITRSETVVLPDILKRLAGRPIVTVSDIEGFANAGGMVEFMVANNGAVSILINRSAAKRQGIQFNAQLLRLAQIVEP